MAPRSIRFLGAAPAVLLLTLGIQIGWGDEEAPDTLKAQLRDGRRASGRLLLDRAGRLSFLVKGAKAPLDWEGVHEIKFPTAEPTSTAVLGTHRAILSGDERVSGDGVRLDKEGLRMRTAWAEKLSVPLAFLVRVEPSSAKRLPARLAPAEREADTVWLANGDERFGQGLRADAQAVELKTRQGMARFAWSDVRAIAPPATLLGPRTTEGEHVRLLLHSPAGADPDVLQGVLTALDDRRVTLRHPTLGVLEIDRSWVRGLRRQFHGRRIELDNGPHHLGDSGSVLASLQPPRAEGRSLRLTVRLESARQADLLVRVVHLIGPGDRIAALERGELRTEVVVNGDVVDYLNRHVDRALAEPAVLRIRIPAARLHTGDNEVVLHQAPDRTTGTCRSCGVDGVAMEIPD